MRSLPRDLRTIQDRQASVNFFSHPDQLELCKALQKCLSNIKNVPRCLRKLSNNQASVKDWKTLVKSVNNMVALCEISQHPTLQEPMRIPICEALRAACTEEVKSIRHHLDNTLDMERSHEKGQAGLVSNSILFCRLYCTVWFLTVSLYICSSGSNSRGESRALEGLYFLFSI